MFTATAYAQTAAGSGAASGDIQAQIIGLAPILLIGVVFYFLLIRPQQQKAKQLKQQQSALRRGDRIITAGGIIGTIAKVVNDDELEVQIAETVKVRVVRSTVTTILAKTEPAKAESAKAETKGDGEKSDETEAPTERKRRGTGGN